MIGVSVRGAEKVSARLRQAATDVRDGAERDMERSTLIIRRMLSAAMTAPERRDPFWGKMGAAQGLSVRSGKTRASLTPGTRVYRTGNLVVGVVGSAEKHLRLHEDGGTITAGGYLRIPTAAAQTPAGVDRNAGRSIRALAGVFLFRSKAGRLWAARRKKSGPLELLYLLVKSVHMKPRHIFANTARDAAPLVREQTNRTLQAVVRKANA